MRSIILENDGDVDAMIDILEMAIEMNHVTVHEEDDDEVVAHAKIRYRLAIRSLKRLDPDHEILHSGVTLAAPFDWDEFWSSMEDDDEDDDGEEVAEASGVAVAAAGSGG